MTATRALAPRARRGASARFAAAAAQGAAVRCFPVSPGSFLVAQANGTCWLLRHGDAALEALPVSAVAVEHRTLTASAVEGALRAGLGPPRRAGPRSVLGYVRWLAGNAAFAAATPGLFLRAADRFAGSGRAGLAAFARRKAVEETGHAELALRDLANLGLSSADAVRLVEPPSAAVFAARFRQYVESDAPVSLFGFSYCLERIAAARDRAFVRRIEALCPEGVRACRFVKVHSAVGSDGIHVREQLEFFDALPASDLVRVVRAAFETAALLADQARIDKALSDDETARRLRGAGTGSCHRRNRAGAGRSQRSHTKESDDASPQAV